MGRVKTNGHGQIMMRGASHKSVELDEGPLAADNLAEAMKLSDILAKSGGSFVPSHLKSPGEVLAAILTGRELGLPPMASMRGIHVINGKPGLDYSLQVALLKKHGYKLEWHEQSTEKADLTLHAPDGTRFRKTFAKEDARESGLWMSSLVWRKYPATMMAARLVGLMCRSFAAEIFAGVYGVDELDEIGRTSRENTFVASSPSSDIMKETVDEKQPSNLVEELEEASDEESFYTWARTHADMLRSMTDRDKRSLAAPLRDAWKRCGVSKEEFQAVIDALPAEVVEREILGEEVA